jgi:Peptidase family S41
VRYALPDFQPDDAGTAAYMKLYADTAAKRGELLKARAIVLDLRFNQGGSSNWAKMLAKGLWGEARVNAALKDYFAMTQTWWRPTAGNLAAIQEFIPLLEQQGDPESAAMVKMFMPIFEAAVKRGDKYLVEPDIPEDMLPAAEADAEALKTPIYVIVPGQCASACLDAIDYFKRFSNTKLIGAPSSADSTYMEVRSAKLPSGYGNAIIPMKMYVDRPRGKGAFYSPDIEMRDFDWSTGNFLKHIEKDLAK